MIQRLQRKALGAHRGRDRQPTIFFLQASVTNAV
jgi:hypothetical protein